MAVFPKAELTRQNVQRQRKYQYFIY